MEGKILGLCEFNRIIVNNITLVFSVVFGWVVFYSWSGYVAQAGFEIIKQEPCVENLQLHE